MFKRIGHPSTLSVSEVGWMQYTSGTDARQDTGGLHLNTVDYRTKKPDNTLTAKWAITGPFDEQTITIF
ncbi:hypothetical protein DPMN_181250 [Dreissena polymorpha]|uniref:Uncharacterized protein n=1 Tax=Dreissena polymorpha TaxID=45954 RepID=A0A9D4DDT8_DREPO|nr:hypothetical protein DPMN_181250 [Dreissena polymorpha]